MARSQSSDGFPVLRAGWCDSREDLLLGNSFWAVRSAYFTAFSPEEKLKRYPPVDCGPHRAHNKSSTRRSLSRSPPGAWSCPCLPSRRTSTCMVTLIERHWRCLSEGSGAAQEAPSLRSRKTKGRSPNVRTTRVRYRGGKPFN